MSLLQDQHKRAHVALNRFGLGAKPGGISRIRQDAKAAVQAELDTPGIALITATGLPTYQDACQAVNTDFTRENGMKEKELAARIAKHLQPDVGFVERLVLFFSNHFSMTINKDGAIMATIGQLERDVIRKNVLGSFKTMLTGVIMHPAMIKYLDNDDSIGPASPTGISWGVGLNHNLAREICELHTMGVGGGYTETDIDSLAKMLTGWSFVRGWEADEHYNGGNPSNRGRFLFRASWHEPGPQTMLGKTFTAAGPAQALAALNNLADHPSTAQFIAFKLVHHFITDQPTPAMVDPVAQAFRTSHGNLKAVAQALIDLPEAWSLPLKKLRTPYELQIAEMRAMLRTYRTGDRWEFYEPLYALKNAPWERPAPDGYPDESDYWIGPDAMRIRLETAQLNAWGLQQQGGAYTRTAPQLADLLFGLALSDASHQAVAGALNLDDGLTTVFMLPEFQRR
jgi:uncharacterized protein (DUF1800 family)